MLPEPSVPLILTLTLDAAAQAFFDRLRQQHFPPEGNYLSAHLTLFHHLSSAALPHLVEQLQAEARQTPPLLLTVTGLLFMGQGVAYRCANEPLLDLHRRLQRNWGPALTPQDRQPLRPHVTVQNKVAAPQARALYEQLSADFTSFQATGQGLHLWAYRGGPWESLAQFAFEAPSGGH